MVDVRTLITYAPLDTAARRAFHLTLDEIRALPEVVRA